MMKKDSSQSSSWSLRRNLGGNCEKMAHCFDDKIWRENQIPREECATVKWGDEVGAL
jgi:hypothetical protein